MPFSRLNATVIGRAARDALLGNPVVSTAGATSRGLFLRVDESRIVFLSIEAHHGPLTFNVSGDPAPLLGLASGEPALLTEDGLVFPAHELEVTTGGALAWQAPLPPRGLLPPGQVRSNLRKTVEKISALQEDPANTLGILPDLRLLLAQATASGEDVGPFLALLKRLRRAVWDGQTAAAAAALEACLGRGTGLTPSGDDLTQGAMLALSRWGEDLRIGVAVEAVRDAVLASAFRQTTTLSANLIECAAAGQADERLVAALDGIATGAPDAETCAAYLRSWGSSSGIDALAGMAAVLLAAQESS
jgi:hypothetical protein